jgi:hypothetical protein
MPADGRWDLTWRLKGLRFVFKVLMLAFKNAK